MVRKCSLQILNQLFLACFLCRRDVGTCADPSPVALRMAMFEEMCKEIAEAGSGTYIHVDNNSKAQQKLEDEIAKMQKGESETIIYSEYDEQFQAVALLALVLLIAEVLILQRKNRLFKNVRIFNRKVKTTKI